MLQKIWSALVLIALAALFAFADSGWRLPRKLPGLDWKPPWVKEEVHGADWCEEHQVERSKDAVCNPALARGGTEVVREREPKEGECTNTLMRINLSPAVAKAVDLALEPAQLRAIAETIEASAETLVPPSRFARVAPRIAGVVREVKGVLGQAVEGGAVLALLESSQFGDAKSDYLQALALRELRKRTAEREQSLFDKKISAGRELNEAQSALEEALLSAQRAEQRLAALGLTAEAIRTIAERKDASPAMELVAPFEGTIVEASAVPGELATSERPLFSVASMERMWVAADVQEADLQKIEKGQRVVFTMEALPDKRFTGSVVAIGGEVDDRTRTVRVVADVKNHQLLLKARMFGRAEITVRPPEKKLLVPKAAVQNDGDCNLVFVSPAPNIYQARKIQVGTVYASGFEVAEGLAEGESVVTRGSFLLKSELLRGQMGVG
jgi:cobalt-zinc-cadmium efflux system membrane fusion protein